MTLRLTFRPAVGDDLQKACRWYDDRQLGLSDQFMDCFRAAVKDLLDRPHTAGLLARDVRRFPVRRFPYGIFYRIVADEIVVLAVLHGRQAMRRLRNRD